jgi:hypothetical protein
MPPRRGRGGIDGIDETTDPETRSAGTVTGQYTDLPVLQLHHADHAGLNGDFTAAGNGGRAVAVLEALTGQIFLATLVARLVAAYRSPTDGGADRRSR